MKHIPFAFYFNELTSGFGKKVRLRASILSDPGKYISTHIKNTVCKSVEFLQNFKQAISSTPRRQRTQIERT